MIFTHILTAGCSGKGVTWHLSNLLQISLVKLKRIIVGFYMYKKCVLFHASILIATEDLYNEVVRWNIACT